MAPLQTQCYARIVCRGAGSLAKFQRHRGWKELRNVNHLRLRADPFEAVAIRVCLAYAARVALAPSLRQVHFSWGKALFRRKDYATATEQYKAACATALSDAARMSVQSKLAAS